MIARHLRPRILEALSDTRVVMVCGARQVGKSTLVEEIAPHIGAAVRTLDDQPTRELARIDPHGFVAGLPDGPTVIDEVQRAPDLLLAIKLAVDRDPTPGRFLLTGSANVLTLPGVADALTGRVELTTLWPLSQAEIEGASENVVDRLFAADPPRLSGAPVGRAAWVERAVQGGFPEPRLRTDRRRSRWFSSYLTTTIVRDLRDLEDVRRADMVPRLVTLLADRAAGITVWETIAGEIGLTADTVRSYVRLLETMYVVCVLPAWRPGVGKRELAAPKVYLADTGLLAYLLRAGATRAAADQAVTGKLFENFVAMEVVKHLAWAEREVRAYHYRDTGRKRHNEVDVVLEDQAGNLVALEAKAAASLTRDDWAALEWLRDQRSERFALGVVIYTGEQALAIGDRLWALPVSTLWSTG